MADRTWNAVDARLYEERWSRNAKLIMGVIIARCPNPYGVYDVPYVILETLFAPEDIDAALDELTKLKRPPIKLYREGEVVWIIRKWGREGKPNEKQQKGAFNTIEGSYNEVWKDFREVYKGYLRSIDGVSDPLPSESESESEPDTEVSKKKHKTVKSDLPEWCYLLVGELFPDLVITEADSKQVEKEKGKELDKQAEVIEYLYRLDGYDIDDIEAVLRWAKTDIGGNDPDWSGWSAQFLSCCQLRVKKHGVMKFAKMKAGYERSKIKKPLRVYEK